MIFRKFQFKPAYFVFAGLLLTSQNSSAQRNLTEIPNPDPDVERASFQVADGFEVKLFA